MKIRDLIAYVDYIEISGDQETDIQVLSQDSRDLDLQQSLYFAVPGTVVDGHGYIEEVIKKGTRAVVCEKLPTEHYSEVTFIKVHDVRKTMGLMASTFYGNPSQELTVIAITGTNGKTSVATYIAQSLEFLDAQVLLLSTAGDYFKKEKITISRKASSSLEIIELHRILRTYVDLGASYCCLEATSHALVQDRLAGIDIDIAVFTNLTQDHLDYHKNFESYSHAKKLLFDNLKESGIAITNRDDEYGNFMVRDSKATIRSYGKDKSDYDYSFSINSVSTVGTKCIINNNALTLPIIGEFNVYNATAAFAVLTELLLPTKSIVSALEHIQGVAGRMEMIGNNRNIIALVDYAHSPDALENVLLTLKEIPHNNIISVMGCGGDRDRKKRPLMTGLAQRLSDKAIYTSDNPRTESLQQIFDDMKMGINSDIQNFHFIESREEAIKTAVNISLENDIILVAGKGHEDYQIIGAEKFHFDDREILEKYLK